MCGIFGNFCFFSGNASSDLFQRMAEAIEHRGPDFNNVYIDEQVALGNTRLSILDLSPSSNQPMYSDDDQVVLVQNGEIYNYIELREELRSHGCVFQTSGDTEVVLRAFETWGEDFVNRLNGMFAIAIYDRKVNCLWLYRDRLGVKPLYYYGTPKNGRLWFASEIKALIAAGISVQPNYDALAQYLALNYIPQPETSFEGIFHLPPAHMAKITPQGMSVYNYWELSDVTPENDMSEAEAKSGILSLIDDATRIRMRSDAKFGAFLSGGLDSSTVVGLMSTYQSQPVRTFSVGFDNPKFDETYFALLASHRFGTVHEARIMKPDIMELWPRFIWQVDQPHGDVSFMPMDYVSSLAARDVKMVLTGDGGDELFAGYEKYAAFFQGGKSKDCQHNWIDEYVRQSGLLQNDEPQALLRGVLNQAFHDHDPYRALSKQIKHADHYDPINRVLYAETTTLLAGNNLVKPDRMAMANSLEVRSPFLDYRMVEFAFRIPGYLKLEGGETKAIYKKAVEPLLGKELTYRKKQMFTLPIGEWLKQELVEYCQSMLLGGRLGSRCIVNEKMISHMIASHVDGTANYTRQLRALISLEIWFRLFIDRDPAWLDVAKFQPPRIS